jgi:hypothetical protein
MRTSTNFFLFSLAVFDIAILIMGELQSLHAKFNDTCFKNEDFVADQSLGLKAEKSLRNVGFIKIRYGKLTEASK